MPTSTLVVPIRLDALVVSSKVKDRDPFRRWLFDYGALEDYRSPEPSADGSQIDEVDVGVHLHWTLPRALRTGARDPDSSEVTYPLVPNRWLVVRMSGSPRVPTAWIVESDCPLTDGVQGQSVARMSAYLVSPEIITAWKKSHDTRRNKTGLDPTADAPQVANLGARFPLAGWKEQAADTPPFLTAVAPGNHAFSIYTPHNAGIFSMVDDLEGVVDDVLSYMVVGWYSDPSSDILAAGRNSQKALDDLLKRLHWVLDPTVTGRPSRSVYQGMALGVRWNRDGNPPTSDPLENIRESGKLNVAFGNSTLDAFTALVSQQGHSPRTLQLLRAFQYDLLPVLNEVNGDALLEEEIRKAWFGSEPGGYRWTIVARESGGDAEVELTDGETAWLARLNQDQAALDDALRQLFALQWDLNATWWKLGRFRRTPPPKRAQWSVNEQQLEHQLDASKRDTIAYRAHQQYAKVNQLLAKVPRPDATAANLEEAFQAGIKKFAGSKRLDDAKTLKAVPAARFHQPSNPAVVVAGVEVSADLDPDEKLRVRIAGALVTGFKAAGKTAKASNLGTTLPKLPAASLPAAVPALMIELLLVDPANASAIAKKIHARESAVEAVMSGHQSSAYTGPLPQYGLEAWSQPWSPIYLEWKLNYTHIPYQSGGHRSWSFDGTGYRYAPGASKPKTEDRDVGGISLLGPSPQFIFSQRLRDYLDKYPNAELSHQDGIKAIAQWKFLSQELTGFHELLALRDGRAFRRPTEADKATGSQVSVADLAGFPTGGATGPTTLPGAFQGRVTSVPYLPEPPLPDFHGLRSGQAYFEQLFLYDKFGRILHLISEDPGSGLHDAKNFPLVRDPKLVPAQVVKDIASKDIASVVELPPRVPQPARLDFDLVDARDQTRVHGRDAGANPIGGWLLPDHLDGSILLFAPDGTALGELRLFAQASGDKLGGWQAPPHSSLTLADLKKRAPLLSAVR